MSQDDFDPLAYNPNQKALRVQVVQRPDPLAEIEAEVMAEAMRIETAGGESKRRGPKARPVGPPKSPAFPPFIGVVPRSAQETLPKELLRNDRFVAIAPLSAWRKLLEPAAQKDFAETQHPRRIFRAVVTLLMFSTFSVLTLMSMYKLISMDSFRALPDPLPVVIIIGVMIGILLVVAMTGVIPKTLGYLERLDIPDVVRQAIAPLVVLLESDLGPNHLLRMQLNLKDIYASRYYQDRIPGRHLEWFQQTHSLGAIALPSGIMLQWRVTERAKRVTRERYGRVSRRPKPKTFKYNLKSLCDFQLIAPESHLDLSGSLPPDVQVHRHGSIVCLRLRLALKERTERMNMPPTFLLKGFTTLMSVVRLQS